MVKPDSDMMKVVDDHLTLTPHGCDYKDLVGLCSLAIYRSLNPNGRGIGGIGHANADILWREIMKCRLVGDD